MGKYLGHEQHEATCCCGNGGGARGVACHHVRQVAHVRQQGGEPAIQLFAGRRAVMARTGKDQQKSLVAAEDEALRHQARQHDIAAEAIEVAAPGLACGAYQPADLAAGRGERQCHDLGEIAGRSGVEWSA